MKLKNIKISKRTFADITTILIILLIINLRPAILGQNYTKLLLIFICILVLIKIAILSDFNNNFNRVKIAIAIVLFGFYLIAQTLFTSSDTEGLIQGLFTGTTIIFVSAACLFIIKDNNTNLILKVVIYFTTIFAISQLITIIGIIFGYYKSLRIGEMSVESYIGRLTLFYPFTICHESGYSIFGTLYGIPRGTGFLREAGLYQIYLIISFFSLDFINIKYKKIIRVILVLALFTTFSTAGITIFIIACFYKLIFMMNLKSIKRILISTILIIMILFITYYFLIAEKYGLLSKLQDVSGKIRMYDIILAISHIKDSPIFGIGFAEQSGFINENINMIVGIAKIGIIGMLLHISALFLGIKYHYTKDTFIIMLPIILTSLISQPIYYTALPIVFLFLQTKNLQNQVIKNVK